MTAKRTTSAAALTWGGVTARRMARHALAEPATDLGPAGVAGVLCGAHAQVLSAAELSIGRRIAGATRSDVRRALWEERALVKTFGPRGTIHLLPTADLPMWTGALSALRTLVTRYLYAYGPATAQHFARWLGIPPRFAAELFGQLGGELECVELDGEPAWTVAGDHGTPSRPHRGIRLLPLLRRVRRRGSAPRTAVPRRGRHPGAHPRRARPETTRCCSLTAW